MDSFGVYISLRGEFESNLESTSSSFLSLFIVFYAAGLNLDKATTLDICFWISLDDNVFLDLCFLLECGGLESTSERDS